MRYFPIILLLLASCKLFESKNTTDPIVNLTIEGGNEISREVTLYLDIEDDSKIDYVEIIIDDTTAVTVSSNFDTISFDVTPFADESEHQLYAKVADSEGNIGESEKLDVVITEFPGWRKFGEVEGNITLLKIDENDRLWIATYYDGVYIFDTIDESFNRIFIDDLEIEIEGVTLNRHHWLIDLSVITDSRLWMIFFEGFAIEYHYDLNKLINSIKLPFTDHSIYFSIVHDSNYDIWMGGTGILHYNHVEFDQNYMYPNSNILTNEIHEVIIDKNDVLYICNEHPPHLVSYNNGNFTDLNAPSIVGYGQGLNTVIDSLGNIWMPGLSKYSGNSWEYIVPNPENTNEIAYPMMVTKDNTLYLRIEDRSIHNNYGQHSDLGIATFKNNSFKYWNEYDSPFASSNDMVFGLFSSWREKPIAEANNGDIWMLLENELWRYRPSLGGYP